MSDAEISVNDSEASVAVDGRGDLMVKMPGTVAAKKGRKRARAKEASVDILRAKMDSLARLKKLKTTQELVAGLLAKSVEIAPSVVQCNHTEMLKNEPDPKLPNSRLDIPIDKEYMMDTGNSFYPLSESSSSSENSAQTVDSSICTMEKQINDIVALLPAIDYSAANSEESLESETKKKFTHNDLHTDLEGVGGNFNDQGGKFCEWQDPLLKASYNGKLLPILPYVVIK